MTIKAILFYFICSSLIHSQLLLHDDFQSKNDHWFWRGDGNQSVPIVKNGLLYLNLIDAVDSVYCNTEIYNPTEPYRPGTQVRIRLKASQIHTGSRGWGFWDGDLNLNDLAYDFDVAWVMQQGSLIDDPVYRWFYFGVARDTLINRQTISLDSLVDETEWQTYKIIWDYQKIGFFVNDRLLYETYENLPDENMRMDVWIDNRIINTSTPTEYWNNAVENSEMMVDYIEISNLNGPSVSGPLSKNVILWESPNTFPNGDDYSQWKEYRFETENESETLFFLTGSAESYEIMADDNLSLQIDDEELGREPDYSLSGEELNGNSKSLVFKKNLPAGAHRLKIFTENTPFLKDVVILNAENGKTLLQENYNEKIETPGLWKTLTFNSGGSDFITVIISGQSDKDEGLRFELNDKNYDWNIEKSISGDSLTNLPNTIVFNEPVTQPNHTLKVFADGNPKIFSIAAYGSGTITGIDKNTAYPEQLKLSANPNPFNASLNISYSTQTRSYNKIRIVNILGEEVINLVDKMQSQGDYNIKWNAGKETSGIYFCILEAGNKFKVEKLILMK